MSDLNKLVDAMGINILTGEADATCCGRLLCDLTPEAAREALEYFGVARHDLKATLPEGMNSSKKFCMMLSRPVLEELMIYHHVLQGKWVVQCGYEWIIGEREDADRYREFAKECKETSVKVWWPVEQRPGVNVGGRNIHQFSGRVE